jgi:lipopolysaccharide transport system ATP-binding protein
MTSDLRPPTSDADVLVRVEGVRKKFCRSLKKSLWYGVKDMAHELNPFSRGQRTEDRNQMSEPTSVLRSLTAEQSSDLRRPTSDLRPGEFWAVNDVSFELKRGECLGLIGHNGAGKTTLLKMLNGLIKPDHGRIEMRGRVGALIALGAGFNPILTGRENVYVNGSVLGLTKREINAKMEDIIDFADIDEFIDSPVQSYSSGMQVRLGFAVAAAMEPDVLLVDEVLAVGDLNFRMKCLSRIAGLLRSGAVIVLVSHSMTDIQRICSEAIVMDHGVISYVGNLSSAISKYENLGLARRHSSTDSNSRNDPVVLTRFSLNEYSPEEGASRSVFIQTGDTVIIRGELLVTAGIKDARLRIFLESAKAGILCSISSAQEHPLGVLEEGLHEFTITFPKFPFLVGAYGVGISVHGEDTSVHLSMNNVAVIEVIGPDALAYGRSNAGIVAVSTEWAVQRPCKTDSNIKSHC